MFPEVEEKGQDIDLEIRNVISSKCYDVVVGVGRRRSQSDHQLVLYFDDCFQKHLAKSHADKIDLPAFSKFKTRVSWHNPTKYFSKNILIRQIFVGHP